MKYLLLVNFINLSANFYHASMQDSALLGHHDPIDSLAELVLEYVFEMDEETIPDTEVPHEKRKLSDVKIRLEALFLTLSPTLRGQDRAYRTPVKETLHYQLFFEVLSPPPKG
ncbi:hypothetical protein A3SI_04467 [Nitritalea halalkaliphila LW7]|uniref:Uncharacterized protein n=2 Tax=Nitritalea TaxID=1187887 RepID=I5C898_9BACT|nr:hypothetical protein A3SI_04467 [Nitritalea halalkaliphila LW7]